VILIEILGCLGGFLWVAIFFLPWRPWSTREHFEAERSPSHSNSDLSNISVLIPARDEEKEIASTVRSLNSQGRGLKVILIDDQSKDQTVLIARQNAMDIQFQVLSGSDLPKGWAGKLWALEQGRQIVTTPLILLMDADIEFEPGTIAALQSKMTSERLDFVSLMAELRMQTFWEKFLIPAYIYFFKLLYPFSLGNSLKSKLGVAAGGCVLLKVEFLEKIGGFGALRGALIDDCTLASKIKREGGRTWVGLTHSVKSHRDYSDLKHIWNLVARSAYTQLRYSPLLLVGCTLAMITMFWMPLVVATVLHPHNSPIISCLCIVGIMTMFMTYKPTLYFYELSPLWVFLMPIMGTLYLAMTWTSAFRYWLGRGSEWKGRYYARDLVKKNEAA